MGNEKKDKQVLVKKELHRLLKQKALNEDKFIKEVANEILEKELKKKEKKE